ncbi:LIC_12337 family protein [Leptospira idonii]|uniref:Uncharacterized protein n=1 Tax=Leptospira idonii TaxID=1193500 RepID=A0A4R9LZQ6_9LEPT|nr:hypothetical protein [Leptospira idonii]TGN19252.1 hypothetical protein EHS15_10075 [Leptospira idonii]
MKKIIYLFLFLGVSLQVSDFSRFSNTESLQNITSQFDQSFSLNLGTEPIFAAANSWGFVRQSATWARGNSNLIDQLIAGLKRAGYFTNTNPVTQTIQGVNLDGIGSTTLRLKLNQSASPIAVQATAFSGTKSFNHFFEITKTGNTSPSLQLFFDDPNTMLGNDGALIYYKLGDFNSSQFANVGGVITESYTGNEASYGTKFQTYTWRNGPENSVWPSDIGRVILTEVDSGKQLCFRSVVRLKFSKLTEISPSSASGLNTLKSFCGNIDQAYYGLAYMQKFDSPFLTTAKATITTSATLPETICNLPNSASFQTQLSYGIFDVNGFVNDGLSASQVPAAYPSPTQGGADFMSVEEAFQRTYQAAGASMGSGKPAISTYEASNKTYLDSLVSGTEANKLDFKSVP